VTFYQLTKKPASELAAIKQDCLEKCTAPLDGMWMSFADMADHFAIETEGTTVGYCVINAEKKLLQFYVTAQCDAAEAFQETVSRMRVTGAFAATCDPQFFSLCRSLQKTSRINALMYQLPETAQPTDAVFSDEHKFSRINSGEMMRAIEFAVAALGADREWLSGYYTGLIARDELFGLRQQDQLIAVGELRASDAQQPCADLGVIVGKDQRRRGIATQILRELVRRSCRQGLKPICSTEYDNIAAQKAIESAGFKSNHQIIDVAF